MRPALSPNLIHPSGFVSYNTQATASNLSRARLFLYNSVADHVNGLYKLVMNGDPEFL